MSCRGNRFFLHGRGGATNVVYCNVTIRNIIYNYTAPFLTSGDGIHTILSWTPASPQVTSLLATYIDSSYLGSYVEECVEGVGYLGQGPTYVDTYTQELSWELMAFLALIFAPKDVLSIASATQKLGLRIQIISFALYVGAVALYG